MKTLKYLFMALLLAATAAGFTSCSDDDDDNGGGGNNNAREIVGTWERETGNYTEKMSFSPDGEYSCIMINNETGDINEVNSEYGTYTIQGNTLTIYTDSGWGYLYESVYEYRINGNILTLTEPEYTYIFRRVN